MLATARTLGSAAAKADPFLTGRSSGAGESTRDVTRRDGAADGHMRDDATRAMTGDIELAIARTTEEFAALEAEWNALFERAGRSIHVFQTFNWCWHWCRHFLPPARERGPRLFIVTARREGRLVLVWPLVLDRAAGILRLTSLGEPVSQYGDLLVDDIAEREDVLDAAWSHALARSGADLLHVRRARADGNLAPLLERHGARVSAHFEAPYLDLATAADFASYEQRFTSKARKNRRRFLRRFEERAPATLTTVAAGARARDLATLAIHLKRAWLKDRGLVSPALADPRTLAFFRDVAGASERPVGCTVTSLDTRGEPAAIEVSFDCKGRRAVHVIVYSLKYERMSAGQLLIDRSLRNCFEIGISTYDLLTPADAYKLDWADGVVEANDWTLARSLRGRAYADLYLARVRPLLKRVVTRLSTLRRRANRASTPAATEA